MRRILLALTASLVMAAMLAASALPALAQGPQTIPPGAGIAVLAAANNPVIDVSPDLTCATLSAPPDNTQVPGHHSDFPNGCSGPQPT